MCLELSLSNSSSGKSSEHVKGNRRNQITVQIFLSLVFFSLTNYLTFFLLVKGSTGRDPQLDRKAVENQVWRRVGCLSLEIKFV